MALNPTPEQALRRLLSVHLALEEVSTLLDAERPGVAELLRCQAAELHACAVALDSAYPHRLADLNTQEGSHENS